MADESKVVSAVATFVGTSVPATAKRIEEAVVAEILKCNAEGISTEEKNSWIIRERVAAARQRVMDEELGEQEGN